MYGRIYGLSSWWQMPDIFEYTVVKEEGDLVSVKIHYDIMEITKEGKLFNTRQEANQYIIDLVQSEINHCETKLAEIKEMISDAQTDMVLIQEQFPNMKVINLLKEKITELQEKEAATQQDLIGFQTSMVAVKEKYER